MHFEAIKNWGGSCCDLEYMDENNEFEAVLELIKYCIANSITTTYVNALNLGYYACTHSLKNSYIFDTDLQLLKCTVEIKLPENYIGILNDDGVLSLNENSRLWLERNKVSKKCRECKLMPQCLGSRCPVRIIKNRDFHCSLDKEMNKFKKLLFQYYG